MKSLMRIVLSVLSAALLFCVSGETKGSEFLGKARATPSTPIEAMKEDTALSGLVEAVGDQISSWEHRFKLRHQTPWVAMKRWSFTLASIVSDYSRGEPFSVAIKNEATNNMPQVAKTVTGNPLLAFGATVFVSFFGESEAGKLEALQKQLMAQVRKFAEVYEKGFEGELHNVEKRLREVTTQIQANIAYVEDAPAGADESWYDARGAFWQTQEALFRKLVNQVFSPYCRHKDWKGASNKCKEFQLPGAIAFQVPFALTHITILLQLAEFTYSEWAQQKYIAAAKKMAGFYHDLLKDSLEYYSYVLGVLKNEGWQKNLHAVYDGILDDIQAVARAK